MRAGAHLRTVFAGFGVSGSLLAAVGAAFVATGGVLAFDSWPAGAGSSPEQSLDVARIAPAPAAQSAPVLDLSAAVLAPGAAPSAAPADGAPAGGPAEQRPVERREVAPAEESSPEPGPVPAVPVPDSATPEPIISAPRLSPLADVVEQTTVGLAQTVRSVGTAAPVAAPVTDLLGASLTGTGQAVGGLVRGLSPEP